MKKIKNIVFLLFMLSLTANGQVAGYLGKRFIVGYSNYFFPGFRGPGPRVSEPKAITSPTINNVNCLDIEYIQKQRRSLCFSLQYLRTGIAYDNGSSSGFFSDQSATGAFVYPNETSYFGDFTTPALLTSVNLGFGCKVFKHGFIAPIGGYQKFEVLFMMETVKYDNKHFATYDNYNYNTPDTLATFGTGEYKYKNIALCYTLGRQRVLFDRVVLDYGMRFAITPAVVSHIFIDRLTNMDSYYQDASRSRIFREQLINIHIGLGFLAF